MNPTFRVEKVRNLMTNEVKFYVHRLIADQWLTLNQSGGFLQFDNDDSFPFTTLNLAKAFIANIKAQELEQGPELRSKIVWEE